MSASVEDKIEGPAVNDTAKQVEISAGHQRFHVVENEHSFGVSYYIDEVKIASINCAYVQVGRASNNYVSGYKWTVTKYGCCTLPDWALICAAEREIREHVDHIRKIGKAVSKSVNTFPHKCCDKCGEPFDGWGEGTPCPRRCGGIVKWT